MKPPPFESYSQNGEDVVLWRALHDIRSGRYIDVGAQHPRVDSVTMAFYVNGWSGITVEAEPGFAQLLRQQRPRDLTFDVAATDRDGDTVTLHVVEGTGLSTLDDSYAALHAESGRATHDVCVRTRTISAILDESRWAGEDIHFMSVDTEGSEAEVLRGTDFSVWRPWILVVESTTPNSTQSTRESIERILHGSGYVFCLFDGLSSFFVAEEHRERFGAALSYPACVLDDYTTLAVREFSERASRIPGLVAEAVRWRSEALTRWADAMSKPVEDDWREKYYRLGEEHHHAMLYIEELHSSSSWRVTRPMRAVSGMVRRLLR